MRGEDLQAEVVPTCSRSLDWSVPAVSERARSSESGVGSGNGGTCSR